MNRTHGALIPARFSTGNQHEDSIEIQIEKCREYCDSHGIPVLDIYPDYAVSGMKQHRTQLDRMMDDLRSGKGDTVVILDQSRLIRNMPTWFQLRNEIAAMGVRLISVTQPFVGNDIRDPNTFMLEGQTAIFNHMWVLMTRQKVLAKMHHMARSGQHTGGKPALGYRVEDGRLVIDEAEAAVVRRIFREYADGKTYSAIIADLNRDGIKTKRGSAFGSNSLHDLMKNEKYIGTLVYGSKVYRPDGTRNSHAPEGTDVVRMENAIPAIIDRETWEKVQERMSGNIRNQGGRPASARDYPLRGKVFCGECGAAMYVRTSKGPKDGGKYYYYACSRKKAKRESDCQNKPIRVEELERMVRQHVGALLGNAKLMQEAADRLRAKITDIQHNGAAVLQALIDQQFDLDARIARLVDAIAAGSFSQAISDKLRQLEGEKAQVELRIKELGKQAAIAQLPAERLQQLYDYIVNSARADNDAVFSVVTRVEICKDKIIILTAFDPDPDPHRPLSDDDREAIESIKTDGTPSGVPIVFIDAAGIGLLIKR